MIESRLVTTKEAAEILGRSTRTLERWRKKGGILHFIKFSPKLIRYDRKDLNEFLNKGQY